jgi:hypothetical protein
MTTLLLLINTHIDFLNYFSPRGFSGIAALGAQWSNGPWSALGRASCGPSQHGTGFVAGGFVVLCDIEDEGK